MKQQKKILRGEAALILAVIINSLGVLLMLQSGSESPPFQACRMRFNRFSRN